MDESLHLLKPDSKLSQSLVSTDPQALEAASDQSPTACANVATASSGVMKEAALKGMGTHHRHPSCAGGQGTHQHSWSWAEDLIREKSSPEVVPCPLFAGLPRFLHLCLPLSPLDLSPLSALTPSGPAHLLCPRSQH